MKTEESHQWMNNAATVWYLKVKEELGKMAAMKSKYDKAIFY